MENQPEVENEEEYNPNLKKMKTIIILALLFFISTIKAQDATEYVAGPHGGMLKTVQDYKIETISSYGCVYAYLYDKSLSPIFNKWITGNIVFVYNKDVSLNIKLILNGDGGYSADMSNSDYYYYKVHFKINGKDISERFDNLSGIADKK